MHTNSERDGEVYRHTGTDGNPFGLVTIVSGVGTRRRAYGERFMSTELRLKGGRIAVVNLYAPVWMRTVTRRAFEGWRNARSGAGEELDRQRRRFGEQGDLFVFDCSSEDAGIAAKNLNIGHSNTGPKHESKHTKSFGRRLLNGKAGNRADIANQLYIPLD